jgi:hypothetical protein
MINIDLTTKNTVYNTLGPQAQWIQHRFGRRKYPDLEIEVDTVVKIVQDTEDTINLISCYGDSSSYSNILDVLSKVKEGRCVFNSHLSFENNQLIDVLNNKQAYVVVPLFGIEELNDKILLHSNWDLVLKNLKNLKCNVCIEFYTYSFNRHQIEKVCSLFNSDNIEIKIKEGIYTHPAGFSPIVNEEGKWLYDVYSPKSKWTELVQTVNGYNCLIQFIKPIKGKSILNKTLIYRIDGVSARGDVSISVTGDVFPSYNLLIQFSNALCNDWTLALSKITENDNVTVKEDFRNVCIDLGNILKYLKQNNNIYKNEFNSILANLANSDV